MNFSVLIIGCGAQGRVISTHMARASEVDEIRLSDINLELCRRYANWLKSDKLSVHKVDANNVDEITSLAKGVDVVVNAVEPRFNLKIMDAALHSGANYIDLAFGPPYENFDKELERSDKFKDIGRTALTATGATPGLTNVVAAYAVDKLDSVSDILIRSYDTIETKEPISDWSPATFLADCLEEAVIFEDGKFKKVPPFSGEEIYTFPDPAIGRQTVYYHAHEEPYTLGRFIGKGLRNVNFKYGSPEITVLKSLWERSIISDKPVSVKGITVIPRDLYLALTPPTVTMEELKHKLETGIIIDSHAMDVVEVIGKKNGKNVRYTLIIPYPSIHDVQRTMPIATHSSYVTSTNCSILTKMLGRGEIKTTGVIPPERLEPNARKRYIAELAAQDPPIIVYERVESHLQPPRLPIKAIFRLTV